MDISKLRLSPSDINSFFFCPRKWYLGIILGIQPMPVPKPELEFGIMIHNIIADYYERIDNKSLTEHEIRRLIVDSFKKGYVKIAEYKSSNSKMKRILKHFTEFELKRLRTWKQFKPTFVEKRLEAAPFVGKVDAYWRDEGIVIDWKTGNYSVMTTELMRQGTIYKLLLEAYNYPVKKVIFAFLDKNKFLEMPITTKGWIENEIKKMVDMIKSGRFPGRHDKLCGRCEFQLACLFGDIHLFEGLECEVIV